MATPHLTVPPPIRSALMVTVAICWIAGCDAAANRTFQQTQQTNGVSTMNTAQTAAVEATAIPPIDAAKPTRLETATFATG